MCLLLSDAEYAKIRRVPYNYLVRDAWYNDVPAGAIVRDLIERFVTPKCYLVVPGDIQDGPRLSIGTSDHPISWRFVGDIIDQIAETCDFVWSVGLDGRVLFRPATEQEMDARRAHMHEIYYGWGKHFEHFTDPFPS